MDSDDERATGRALELPDREQFARLGLVVDRELHGGHQSRVVVARRADIAEQGDPAEMVVKVVATSPDERPNQLERLRVRDQVSRHDDRVVPILPVAGNKVNRIGDCLGMASPLIEGRRLDTSSRPDVERMARALARLHESLRLVRADLPPVLALRAVEGIEGLNENHQLLHGDFDPANLILDNDGRLWIFDFDDCGYGPVEFELGNTLFMTLFASSRSLNQPSDTYRQFRTWFLGAYRASAEHPISELLVDLSLQTRSDALRYWLTHLDEAPVGIRMASDEWHRQLRAFAGVMVR